MSALLTALDVLDGNRIPYALIGAGAMAAHGVSRTTHDLDLLTLDPRVLEPDLWATVGDTYSVTVRRGDLNDPLAGVVSLSTAGSRDLDIVVGRYQWQQRAIDRSVKIPLGELEIPVVQGVDLVLLKLYAGGPQDAWDITQLLATSDGNALAAGVEAELAVLPAESRRLWRRIVSGL